MCLFLVSHGTIILVIPRDYHVSSQYTTSARRAQAGISGHIGTIIPWYRPSDLYIVTVAIQCAKVANSSLEWLTKLK